MGKRKTTETSFEQVMKAYEAEKKKEQMYDRACERRVDIVKRFPECRNKLFVYDDTEYVVSKRNRVSSYGDDYIQIEKLNR